jgi:hypothetical protein
MLELRERERERDKSQIKWQCVLIYLYLHLAHSLAAAQQRRQQRREQELSKFINRQSIISIIFILCASKRLVVHVEKLISRFCSLKAAAKM